MRKLYIIFCFAFCLMGQWLLGQAANNNLAFPTSNNTFLGKGLSSSTGVDLYSGIAQVSIPICILPSAALPIPVSLGYVDGRGVKVQEYASQVGLGWQQDAGGSVSRVVRGFPDEQPNGYLGNGTSPSGSIGTGGQWGKVITNHLKNSVVLTSAQSDALYGTSFGLNPPTADGEPDIFYVKTPFFAFQFSFDENGNPIFSNSMGYKIITTNFNNSAAYSSASFEVIDGNGNQFYFGSSSSSVEKITDSLYGKPYTFPTTWYLDKIIAFNSKDVINFEYTSYFSSDTIYHYTYSKVFDLTGQSPDGSPAYTKVTKVLSPKFVTKITSGQGEVDFVYNTGRLDIPSSAKLASITLKAGDLSTTYSTYRFYYSYFGSPSTDINILRLKLDSITQTGNTQQNAMPLTMHEFTYGNNLPDRKILYDIDFFGYYTSGTASSNPYNQSLAPNISQATAGVLTSVKDLTGRKTTFAYELNDYYNGSTNKAVGGLRVKSITINEPYMNVNYTTSYSYLDPSNGHSSGQILSNSYTINSFSASCGQTKTFSESPSNYSDLNGNFIGYSYVKVVDPNGGYAITKFSNFSDYPDSLNYSSTGGTPNITSSISYAYKRGLVLDKAVYNSAGKMLTEDISPLSYYTALSTLSKSSYAFKWGNINVAGRNSSCSMGASSTYWTFIDNFRLTKVVHRDYDMINSANYIETTTNYTYAGNHRNVRNITTTNSKGQTIVQSRYYVSDKSDPSVTIPMLSTADNTAISAMISANDIDELIHETNNTNGAIIQTHNHFGLYAYTTGNKIFLDSVASYKGSTYLLSQRYNYDEEFGNPISSAATYGKYTAVQYGYNSTLPVANIENASSVCNYTVQSQTSTGGMSPAYFTTPGVQASAQITTATGQIVITIQDGLLGSYIDGSLTGPTGATFSLSSDGSGPGGSKTINVLPGTYTLTATAHYTAQTSIPYLTFTYPTLSSTKSFTNEFFYDGFEDIYSGTVGNAHTGDRYYNGSYVTDYTAVNGRAYLIQWWNFSSNKWHFNQSVYSKGMTLTGPVDDVRIFPKDAQMTSFSYDPIFGVTGKIDPSGQTARFTYDGFGNSSSVIDNDGNIVSQNYLNYQGQPMFGDGILYTNAGGTFSYKRNNCPTGYIGTGVNYIIPAGKYTSSISQADADLKQQNELDANGQANANANGACVISNVNISFQITDKISTSYTSFIIEANGITSGPRTINGNNGTNTINMTIPSSSNSTIKFTFSPFTGSPAPSTVAIYGPIAGQTKSVTSNTVIFTGVNLSSSIPVVVSFQ